MDAFVKFRQYFAINVVFRQKLNPLSLLIGNYVGFPFPQKSMTLNDLERSKRICIHRQLRRNYPWLQRLAHVTSMPRGVLAIFMALNCHDFCRLRYFAGTSAPRFGLFITVNAMKWLLFAVECTLIWNILQLRLLLPHAGLRGALQFLLLYAVGNMRVISLCISHMAYHHHLPYHLHDHHLHLLLLVLSFILNLRLGSSPNHFLHTPPFLPD